MMRVLLVEDDPRIGAAVRQGLEEARFVVETAQDGLAGLKMALACDYDVLVLDVMLPGMDGWQVVDALRRRRCVTPVLMLTARDSVEDRVRGLEGGADDYLPKPFDFRELLARLRALVRRERIHRQRIIRVADLEIDTVSHQVTRAGREVALTPREYTLLEALASNEGRIITRQAIMDRIWMDEESFSNTVDVHVSGLRRKIDAGRPVRLIHTVYGTGYVLRRPEEGARSRGAAAGH